MAGMLRCKDDKELDALLKGSHVTVREYGKRLAGGVRFVPEQPLVEVKDRGRAPAPRGTDGDDDEGSELEQLLAGQISAVGNLPEPKRHYPHIRGRKHDLDFAWPDWTVNGMQIGIEVQGMAHRVKGRFLGDLEKRALGMLQGWLVLEVGGEQIKNGKAMAWLQELFQKAVKK